MIKYKGINYFFAIYEVVFKNDKIKDYKIVATCEDKKEVANFLNIKSESVNMLIDKKSIVSVFIDGKFRRYKVYRIKD